MRLRLSPLLLLAAAAAAPAPSAATVVDIDALVNGTTTPVLVALPAGTYAVTPIGTAAGGRFDAWNPWGSTTCADTAGCPWSAGQYGWVHTYAISSPALASVAVGGVVLDPLPAPGSGADTWLYKGPSTTVFNAGAPFVQASPAAALAAAVASVITIGAPATVEFSIIDSPYGDNLGGVSLSIAAVPEAPAAATFGAGLAALVLLRARRRAPAPA